jgi:glucose/arabinose dehydrogenase
METKQTGNQARPEPQATPDLISGLATVYAPLMPFLKRFKSSRSGKRNHVPGDINLPAGFTAEVVAKDLNAPVHCTFDDAGFCYVSESGHKIDSRPRILRIDLNTGEKAVFFELPEERWVTTGALTGATWHDGALYFSYTDTISRVEADGSFHDIVTDLPGKGDHHTNHPVIGPDGKLYWGQGTATNLGVVGADNAAYEWLPKFPDFCDVPGQDIVLAGRNFEFPNVLGNVTETVRTGAYVPFGTETQPGQVITGNAKCNGAILRCNLDGSDVEMVAWGLRNPYGIAFDQSGRLFATEHGIDERGGRKIVEDTEDFYEITEGAWYGWPDFAAGIRLDDPHWGTGGGGREPVLAEHPDPNPPKPFLSFAPHSAPNGFDICRDPSFGFEGQAFVALFGDLAPITSRPMNPRGFKVVRIDLENREVVDFAVNKIAGPASKLPHAGFERPSHCSFGPDGALYVVDWGEIEIALERGGPRIQAESGTLWRIRRTGDTIGSRPKESVVVPLNGMVLALQGLGVAVGAAGVIRAIRRIRRR